MSTVLVSLEEYLDTAYSPDREYVDGVVVERHVGEKPHSRVQRNLIICFEKHYPDLFPWPEQRVRTIPNCRSRVPDVCVTLEEPEPDVFDEPPFIVVEILSRRDEMTRVLEKLAEYRDFGVQHIWLLDPRRKRAFIYEYTRLEEILGDVLAAGDVRIPLNEVFRGL